MSLVDLERFMREASQLAEEAREGQRIKDAAKNGRVEPVFYNYQSAPGESGRLREMARQVIFECWNRNQKAVPLNEIYSGVMRKIAEDLEDGVWPHVWNSTPIKRTIDRRAGELHEDHPEFWPNYDFPPVILLRPGWLIPNPRLFDDKVRQDIAHSDTTKDREDFASSFASRSDTNQASIGQGAE